MKGFTLMETIIYIAVLTAILLIIAGSLLVMIRSFGDLRLVRSINTSGETAMERMTREIRLANAIDPASTSSHLKLDTTDSSGNPTTIEFFLSGDDLMVQEGVAAAQNLTAADLTVTNLVFRQISAASISKGIKIEIEIRGNRGDSQKTEKFYNTVILRGSYKKLL